MTAYTQAKRRWYLGSLNDGLFILDRRPSPSNDYPWHDRPDRPDGPDLVLNVCALSDERAQAIVDAHNAALAALEAPQLTADNRERIAETIWRSEYTRATGKERSIPWSEVGEVHKDQYRFIADDVLSALERQEWPSADDLNLIKAFWRAQPSCLALQCSDDCNPMTTHCSRAADVFAQHNAQIAAQREYDPNVAPCDDAEFGMIP